MMRSGPLGRGMNAESSSEIANNPSAPNVISQAPSSARLRLIPISDPNDSPRYARFQGAGSPQGLSHPVGPAQLEAARPDSTSSGSLPFPVSTIPLTRPLLSLLVGNRSSGCRGLSVQLPP